MSEAYHGGPALIPPARSGAGIQVPDGRAEGNSGLEVRNPEILSSNVLVRDSLQLSGLVQAAQKFLPRKTEIHVMLFPERQLHKLAEQQ